MTLADRIHASLRAFWNHFATMGPSELALNAGLTMAFIVAAVVIVRLLNWGLCQAISHLPGESLAARNRRARKALQMTRWVMTLIVAAITFILVLGVWEVDVLAWTSEGVGRRIATTALRVIAVVLLATLAMEAVGLLSRRALNRLRHRSADPRRDAQLETLGPLVRRTLQLVILVLALMTLLSQVGVQIGPILAGAGVVGIAIGFGAQTVVKDLLTGFFLVVEDIVAVGDTVKIQDVTGGVEDMTLRTIRLRDGEGTLHIFPYGEAQVIHNMTRSFAYAVFVIPVSYDADLDKAMQLMREVAGALRQDPQFAPHILADIEVNGIDLLTDVSVQLSGRIRTEATQKWPVLREFYRRLKQAYDEAGIRITHKPMVV